MLTPQKPPPAPTPRPQLTAEKVVGYLDWIMHNLGALSAPAIDLHLRAAELAIRTKANEAQGKATQHTLVEDGTIAPPPSAS